MKQSKLLQLIVLLFCGMSFSQVGINTSTPAEDAMLDIETTDKGLLIPRVSIDDLSTIAPINTVSGGNSESLLVYNTNEDLANNITKGFYYWSGTEWVGIDGRNSNDWSIEGNLGTDPDDATRPNFLGTIDAQDFAIRTNNSERMRISSDGFVGVNTAPTAYRLSVNANGAERGFLSLSEEGYAIGAGATSTSAQTIAIVGVSGGNTFRIPGDGSDVAVAGNSKDYGLYMTVDGAGGAVNKIGGVFNLDDNTNSGDGIGLAIAQLAGSFNSNSTVFGGLFNSQDFGVYAIGGSQAAVFADGDLRATQDVQFDAYGEGNYVGLPAYTLGVDANGNLVEIDAEIGQSVKFRNTSTTQNLNSSSAIEVDIFGNPTWNDNGTLYAKVDDSDLSINSAGRYEVNVNLSLTSPASTRVNIDVQITVNDTPVGTIASSAYIRNTGNHNNSSINFTETLELNANDQLSIIATAEANISNALGPYRIELRDVGTSNITITKLR